MEERAIRAVQPRLDVMGTGDIREAAVVAESLRPLGTSTGRRGNAHCTERGSRLRPGGARIPFRCANLLVDPGLHFGIAPFDVESPSAFEQEAAAQRRRQLDLTR